jgi:hypothetical protein
METISSDATIVGHRKGSHELDLYHTAAAQIAHAALTKASSTRASSPLPLSPRRSFALMGHKHSASATSSASGFKSPGSRVSNFSLPNPDVPLRPDQRISSFSFMSTPVQEEEPIS